MVCTATTTLPEALPSMMHYSPAFPYFPPSRPRPFPRRPPLPNTFKSWTKTETVA